MHSGSRTDLLMSCLRRWLRVFNRIGEGENKWEKENKPSPCQIPEERWNTERKEPDKNTNKELGVETHTVESKVYSQAGRHVMKIQSVTLNTEVSLAMNLLEGRQRHRQRLISTEERGLRDTALLKINAPLFLHTKTWRKPLDNCLINFDWGFDTVVQVAAA